MNEFNDYLVEWLASEWASHTESNYRSIEAIPSGGAKFFVNYIRALSDVQQRKLIEALKMKTFATTTQTGMPTPSMVNEEPALQAYHNAKMTFRSEWNTFPIRMKKSIHDSITAGNDMWIAFKDFIEEANDLRPALAKQIRPALVKTMKGHFESDPTKIPGGELIWKKPLGSKTLFLYVTFRGLGQQLGYNVGISEERLRWPGIGMSYETLMGFCYGGWDQIEAQTIDGSVGVLSDLLSRLEGLYSGIEPLIKMHA